MGVSKALVKKHARTVVVAGKYIFSLADVIHRWWKGNLSGKECAFNCAGIVRVGLRDTKLLARLGHTFYGQKGEVIGAVANEVFVTLLDTYFGLPHTDALENAYRFLGVDASATDDEIKTAYRKLAKKYHPDKGGDDAQFIELQSCKAIILESREKSSSKL